MAELGWEHRRAALWSSSSRTHESFGQCRLRWQAGDLPMLFTPAEAYDEVARDMVIAIYKAMFGIAAKTRS